MVDPEELVVQKGNRSLLILLWTQHSERGVLQRPGTVDGQGVERTTHEV